MISKSNALFVFTAYLTFCCCVYQILYWYPFGINGLEMISFSDIVQTTLIRLSWTFLSCLLSFGCIQLLIFINPKHDREYKTFYPKTFILNIVVVIIISVVFFKFIDIKFWSLALSFFISFTAGSIGYFNKIIYNKELGTTMSKTIISCACMFIGIDSALTGYKDSSLIEYNISFKYAEIAQSQVQNKVNKTARSKLRIIKFIGFKSSGEFVFVSIDNKDIYFIKNDTIVLKSFNKKS